MDELESGVGSDVHFRHGTVEIMETHYLGTTIELLISMQRGVRARMAFAILRAATFACVNPG